MRTLTFVESADHVRQIVARRESLRDATIVCLSPGAAVGLHEAQLPFRYPDHYIDSSELQETAAGHFGAVDEICSVLDDLVSARVGQRRHVSAQMFYKNLKLLYDTVTLRVLQIVRILEVESPELIVYGEWHDAGFDDRLLFRETESIYSRMVPLCAATVVPHASLVVLRSDGVSGAPRAPLKEAARLSREWLRALCRLARPVRAGPFLCVAETGYGLDEVLTRLEQRTGLRFWYTPVYATVPFRLKWLWTVVAQLRAGGGAAGLRRVHGEAWSSIARSERIRTLLAYRGISLYEVLRSRLAFLVTDMLPRAVLMRAAILNEFDRHGNPRAVFSVNFSPDKPWTYALALAARLRGVPVITYQHSAFGYFFWPYSKYVDEVMSDYRLVWGQGAVRFMREHDPTDCKPVVVGSLEIQTLRRRIAEAKRGVQSRPIIVYPLAGYTGNRFYFAHHRLTDTATFELAKRVITTLSVATYADVIVKVYPGQLDSLQQPIDRWLAQASWPNVKTVSGGRFADLLANASLIVIDSPSTVLVQSVLSDARLVVHTGVYKFVDSALALLRRRANVFASAAPFLECLATIVKLRDFDNAPYRNDEFATEFCGGPDRDAVACMAETLLQMCNAHTSSPGLQ